MHRDQARIYQLYVEAYSANTINKLQQKFNQDRECNADAATMGFYIRRFGEIHSSPKLQQLAQQLGIKNPRDIFDYSWKQLEQVVDQFPVKSKEQIKTKAAGEDLIYNQDDVQVYRTDTQEKCIYYGQQHFGEKFTFCISRPGDGNMYDNYRLDGHSFYFVRTKAYDDPNQPLHHRRLVVIHATPDPDVFYYTNARNNGDEKMAWNNIEDIHPQLKGLKQLFKFIPYSAKELAEIKELYYNAEGFGRLPPDLQHEYLNDPDQFISSWDFRFTPVELQRIYLDNHPDPANMFVQQAAVNAPRSKRKAGPANALNKLLTNGDGLFARAIDNLKKGVAAGQIHHWNVLHNGLFWQGNSLSDYTYMDQERLYGQFLKLSPTRIAPLGLEWDENIEAWAQSDVFDPTVYRIIGNKMCTLTSQANEVHGLFSVHWTEEVVEKIKKLLATAEWRPL